MRTDEATTVSTPPEAHPDSACHGRHSDALRCDCGSLLARLVDAGVELKCRRCKRVVVVPLLEDARHRGVAPSRAPPS